MICQRFDWKKIAHTSTKTVNVFMKNFGKTVHANIWGQSAPQRLNHTEQCSQWFIFLIIDDQKVSWTINFLTSHGVLWILKKWKSGGSTLRRYIDSKKGIKHSPLRQFQQWGETIGKHFSGKIRFEFLPNILNQQIVIKYNDIACTLISFYFQLIFHIKMDINGVYALHTHSHK